MKHEPRTAFTAPRPSTLTRSSFIPSSYSLFSSDEASQKPRAGHRPAALANTPESSSRRKFNQQADEVGGSTDLDFAGERSESRKPSHEDSML